MDEDVYLPGETVAVKGCKFEIGVQAKDNWGWCNGDGGGAGAYDDACKTSLSKPYEYYDGFIYMIP